MVSPGPGYRKDMLQRNLKCKSQTAAKNVDCLVAGLEISIHTVLCLLLSLQCVQQEQNYLRQGSPLAQIYLPPAQPNVAHGRGVIKL